MLVKTPPSRIYTDIDMSFATITSGDIAKRVDVNSVKQSLKNLLMTQRGERLFHPEIGSDLYNLLFEPMDALTVDTLKDVILLCIQNFEPRVRVEKIVMAPDIDANVYNVTLYFYVIGFAQLVTFNLTLQRLR